MFGKCLERNFFLPTQGRNPERAARASQSVSFVAPPRAHYTTVSTDLSTRSTHVLSTRSLGRLNFATRSVSPSTQGDPRCSLPYTTGRDCVRQSGGGWGEENLYPPYRSYQRVKHRTLYRTRDERSRAARVPLTRHTHIDRATPEMTRIDPGTRSHKSRAAHAGSQVDQVEVPLQRAARALTPQPSCLTSSRPTAGQAPPPCSLLPRRLIRQLGPHNPFLHCSYRLHARLRLHFQAHPVPPRLAWAGADEPPPSSPRSLEQHGR